MKTGMKRHEETKRDTYRTSVLNDDTCILQYSTDKYIPNCKETQDTRIIGRGNTKPSLPSEHPQLQFPADTTVGNLEPWHTFRHLGLALLD